MFRKMCEAARKFPQVSFLGFFGILSAIVATIVFKGNLLEGFSTENQYGLTAFLFFMAAFMAIEIVSVMGEHADFHSERGL